MLRSERGPAQQQKQEFPPAAERGGSADRRAAPPGAPRRARGAPLRRHAHLPAAGTANSARSVPPVRGRDALPAASASPPTPVRPLGRRAAPKMDVWGRAGSTERSADSRPAGRGPGRPRSAAVTPPRPRPSPRPGPPSLRFVPSQPRVAAPPLSRCSATPAVAPPDPARSLPPLTLRSARCSAAVRGGGGGSSAPLRPQRRPRPGRGQRGGRGREGRHGGVPGCGASRSGGAEGR